MLWKRVLDAAEQLGLRLALDDPVADLGQALRIGEAVQQGGKPCRCLRIELPRRLTAQQLAFFGPSSLNALLDAFLEALLTTFATHSAVHSCTCSSNIVRTSSNLGNGSNAVPRNRRGTSTCSCSRLVSSATSADGFLS